MNNIKSIEWGAFSISKITSRRAQASTLCIHKWKAIKKHFKLERTKTMSGSRVKRDIYIKNAIFPCRGMKSGSLPLPFLFQILKHNFFLSFLRSVFFFRTLLDDFVLSCHWLLFIKSLPENNDFFSAHINGTSCHFSAPFEFVRFCCVFMSTLAAALKQSHSHPKINFLLPWYYTLFSSLHKKGWNMTQEIGIKWHREVKSSETFFLN